MPRATLPYYLGNGLTSYNITCTPAEAIMLERLPWIRRIRMCHDATGITFDDSDFVGDTMAKCRKYVSRGVSGLCGFVITIDEETRRRWGLSR